MTAVLVALPLALALLLAALPVVLVPMALATKRPPGVARAFLGGWLMGVLLVGGVVIALIDVLVLPSGNATWFAYAKIVIGLLLILLGLKRWSDRRESDPEPPGWLAGVEVMSAGKAFGLGLLLATLNPKNVVIVVAAATAIGEATPVPAQQIVALLVFTVVGSLGVAAPVVATLALGDRADERLAAADTWMTRHSGTIVSIVLVVLGVVVAVNGFTAVTP
jgi:threonine/homoserine/homoserine lactone efflux protein